MPTFEQLVAETNNINTLKTYLSDNFTTVYDYFTLQKHSTLIELREEYKRYIALNWQVLSRLDKNNSTHLSFISLLLEVCERLGLRGQFKLLFDFLLESTFDIGSRLKASSLYLINVNTVDDYLEKFESIYDLLQSSYELEEDNQDKVLTTLINYYSQVLLDFGDFNIESVKALREKIDISFSNNTYSFLQNQIIENILKVDLGDNIEAFSQIHILLDTFLGRDTVKAIYKKDFLLESDTEYSLLLVDSPLNFNAIRQISVNQYDLIKDDSVFYSLQRGVKILTKQSQLSAYMFSFGSMHYEKLRTAFEFLPNDFFNNEVDIIDWGCGQAMATMTYFDFLLHKNINQTCNHITLIEPSELALKRGSLHVKKYFPNIEIETINKDLDSLRIEDFINNHNKTKFHLFSNILDIDLFSLTDLIKRIESKFKGVNYFVCVSPYVNDLKTNRIDTFVKNFSESEHFVELKSINNKKGEWKNNWTRVMRVFKTKIS